MDTYLDEIPGYTIRDEIARTDRAIVYRAEVEDSGEPVAAKLLRNDKNGHHEVEMLRRIVAGNPTGPVHVVRLKDIYEDGDNLWLFVEYFDSTLEDLRPSEMTPLALKSIALDSSKGLVEMHRAGIVDDDVKPGNIAFKYGSGRVAHIDLGCARLTGHKPVGYTPQYAAPEIERGRPSDASPCFGWARTMEEIVTGKFGLGPREVLCDYVPWVGKEFSRLVAQCCHDDPGRRPSVTELHERVKIEIQRKKRCPRCNAVRFRDAQCINCNSI